VDVLQEAALGGGHAPGRVAGWVDEPPEVHAPGRHRADRLPPLDEELPECRGRVDAAREAAADPDDRDGVVSPVPHHASTFSRSTYGWKRHGRPGRTRDRRRAQIASMS